MAANTSVATSAGTTFSICATVPATFDMTGYAALTWVPVGEITDLGEFGREYALVTHSPVGSRGTVKKKGSYNEGTIALQLGLNTDDAGQILLKAGSNSDADYSFRVVTQNLDVYYFRAQTMKFKVSVGGVDKILSAMVNLELTTNSAGVGIVEALAA